MGARRAPFVSWDSMFDIGFSEMLVIGLVALIVIGPERLPRVARTLGHLAGRLQRYVADVKADINREVELEELRKMKDSVQEAAAGIENSVQSELDKTESELNAAANPVADTTPVAAAVPATDAAAAEAPGIPEKSG
jgi:sec-independent protein translocase protein TatB